MSTEIIITTKEELSQLIKDALSEILNQNRQNDSIVENSKKFLTVEETCKFLSIARQTLYAYTSNRQIPFIKKSGKNYFKLDDLENWLNSGKIKTFDEIRNEVYNGRKR
ncbi:MAG: excisionase [Bacteroidota bacterium]|jgi:excisionase family DNA binding protein